MSFTLANARTFMQDYDYTNGSSRATRIYNKIANDACIALHQAGRFDFDRRRGQAIFPARKTAGTVSVAVNGNDITGVGTSFAEADIGGYVRFAGEDLQYEVTGYTSSTAIAADKYRGATALSGATYELTFERQALPSRFRDFDRPILSSGDWVLQPKSLAEIMDMRMYARETGEPRFYCIDWVKLSSTTTVKTAYILVYPSPSEKRVLSFPYLEWPSELTADADDFGTPDTPAADRLVREFLLAFLYREQKDFGAYQTQLQYAEENAARGVSLFRGVKQSTQRSAWTPHSDLGAQISDDTLEAGEPAYE